MTATTTTDIEVYELGEDSNAWLVQGTASVGDAFEATTRWLLSTIGHDDEAFGEAVKNLAEARSETGPGWYFHDDGVHDPIVARTDNPLPGIDTFVAVAFGLPKRLGAVE